MPLLVEEKAVLQFNELVNNQAMAFNFTDKIFPGVIWILCLFSCTLYMCTSSTQK
jgi:hypothetical protein